MKKRKSGGANSGASRLRGALAVSSALLALCATAAKAQDWPLPPRDNYGGAGLIDMPSARMAPDGELSASVFFAQDLQRYTLGFQVLPWLEASFRYSGLQHFHPNFPVYFDRSFALKARLWQEGAWMPALAIGVNDAVGTGIYGGEYIVLSKRFGDVDATLGLGWGRMGSTGLFRNPLSLLSNSFDARGSGANAGATNFSTLFHGRDVGLFGGLTWNTPVEGLTLIGEYSSDAYTAENAAGTLRPRNQFNFGASYQLSSTIQLGVNWLYGRSIGGNLTFLMDPVRDSFGERIGPPMPPANARTPDGQQAGLIRLLDARNGTGRAEARRRAFLSNAELVDALWRDDSVTNVAVNGNAVTLSLSRGNAQAACQSAAQLLGRLGSAVIQVNVSLNSQTVSCPVVSAPPVSNYPVVSAIAVASQITAMGEPMVINASGAGASLSLRRIEDHIKTEAARQRLTIVALALRDGEATVYYSNNTYFSEAEALERLTRLLMSEAPPEIERFRLIATTADVPIRAFTLLRTPLERELDQTVDLNLVNKLDAGPAPMSNPVLTAAASGSYPRFSWGVFPQFRQALFDPTEPFGVQILAAAAGTVELLPGLSVSGQAEASIFDTFSTGRASNSVLPHVRTDFLQYFVKGKNGIANLEADYRFRLAPTLFGVARAGYLETMFAGFGGELLYRPEGARWAMGLDLYAVRQREFDRLFGFRKYQTVTGHFSFYYQAPWYGLNMNVRFGRYLAGDYGATFEVTRRFDTGVEVGAFFTKTNVTAAQFGEGSFDKGIIIRIPLSWTAPLQSQAQFNLDLRPVQRDGGQRMSGDALLYGETRRLYEGPLAKTMPW